ncbi:MAG: DsbA family protein [Truepera sp.]|nr:DsbA family protein [Truepera sp.]
MNIQKLTATTAIVLIVAILGIIVYVRLAPAASPAPVVTGTLDLSQAPMLGNPAAPVAMVLFESFTCPACRIFEENDLPRLVREFVDSGKARLYFVHFHLDASATTAGIAAECVRAQSELGFWEYKTVLYRTQQQGFAPARLINLARDYVPGLDLSAFESCLSERRTEERVRMDFAMASRAGVNATPTVFVNGRPVSPSYQAVRAALEALGN